MTTLVASTDPRVGKRPAYKYIRSTDKLPSTDKAADTDALVAKVKLFNPSGAQTWYIAGFDPETGLCFGVVDLGFGCAELGDFDINEVVAIRGALGLPVERDLYWTPKPVSELIF